MSCRQKSKNTCCARVRHPELKFQKGPLAAVGTAGAGVMARRVRVLLKCSNEAAGATLGAALPTLSGL